MRCSSVIHLATSGIFSSAFPSALTWPGALHSSSPLYVGISPWIAVFLFLPYSFIKKCASSINLLEIECFKDFCGLPVLPNFTTLCLGLEQFPLSRVFAMFYHVVPLEGSNTLAGLCRGISHNPPEESVHATGLDKGSLLGGKRKRPGKG